MFDFDTVISRHGTHCEKWDNYHHIFEIPKHVELLPMWVADMDFLSPPVVMDEIVSRAKHGIYGYTVREEGLFTAILNWLEQRHQWQIKKEWLSFSPGVVPALSACVRAYSQPNDKIIIFTPVYTPFFNIIKKNNRIPLINPLKNLNGHYVIDFELLEQSIDNKTTMLILCSPHNPIGRVWTKEELLHIGKICLKHKITIISDEIHHDLVFPPYKHHPIANLSSDLKQITITCTAPSKTFNIAGLSSSLVIIPNQILKNQYDDIMEAQAIGEGNIFGISAMETVYKLGGPWHDELILYLQQNLLFIESFLKQHFPNQEIKLIKPEATYLAWLDFTELQMKLNLFHQKDLCDFLIHKAKVGLSDGLIYSSKEHLEGKGFMRLNFGCPRATLVEGLEKIAHAVKVHLGN